MDEEAVLACPSCNSRQPFVPFNVNNTSQGMLGQWRCPGCGFYHRETNDYSVVAKNIGFLEKRNRETAEKTLYAAMLRRGPRPMNLDITNKMTPTITA